MYDLHNHVLLHNANANFKVLGLRAATVTYSKKFDAEQFQVLKKKSVTPLYSAFEINAERPGEMKKHVDAQRPNVDVLLVNAKELRVLRAAVQDSRIDLLTHAFLDQSAARDAAENNVAVEINLRALLMTTGTRRASLFSKIQFMLRLSRKYKFDIVATSGAHDVLEMRNSRAYGALLHCIGFKPAEVTAALHKTPAAILQKRKNA